MNNSKTVAIVGCGLIGRAWAAIFARAGWNVRLTDPDAQVLAEAPELVGLELAVLARHGLADDVSGAVARLHRAGSLEEAVAGADFVQENGPENVDVKRALFERLDAAAPQRAILASSTSAIVASRFTEHLAGRARCLVGHPVNPPHLIPLVELSGAPWTSADTIERARAVYLDIGEVPITVLKETDGFILNRLQGALLAEAFRLVGEGYVSAEDLDKTVKEGLGLRWSFMGPFETIELNAPGGVADYCTRYTGFYKMLAAQAAGAAVYESPNIERVIEAWPHAASPERITRRTMWRNETLAALAAHKAKSPQDR